MTKHFRKIFNIIAPFWSGLYMNTTKFDFPHKRGRHLNSSVANWKNRRPVFDLLRKVIQGQQFLGQFWTARTVHWNIKFGARVGGTWRNWYPDPFRPESGCLFLHVPVTLEPKFGFCLTHPGVNRWPKRNWPWTTFLSRPNEVGRFFQFATEYFKCRPLITFSNISIQV